MFERMLEMLPESAGWRYAEQNILLGMDHLWFPCPVRFERSGENRGGGNHPDHVESKHFDPWRARSAFESER